jgi:hypothetical protein
MQRCLLTDSAVGILAVDGSHVRDSGSTLSRLVLPLWSCSGAETAALGVRGHLNRTRFEATQPWLAVAGSLGSAASERRSACCAHAAVFHMGAGAWTVNAISITDQADGSAVALDRPASSACVFTHAVHALCIPAQHSPHVLCSVALTNCHLVQLPGAVRVLGAAKLAVARSNFSGCGVAVDCVMACRAHQRSKEPPHSLLLPAAWTCGLDVRDSSFDGGGGCAVRCRWMCLIERLRPGIKPTPVVKAPQHQQPLLAAVTMRKHVLHGGSNVYGGAAAAAASSPALSCEPAAVPVMIDSCSFCASGLEFVGCVGEFPAAFAGTLSPSFEQAAADASAWSSGRSRADSAWAAAVVLRCLFNEAGHSCGGGGTAAAVPSVCVRAAADIALVLQDCVFSGHVPTRHAVTAARCSASCLHLHHALARCQPLAACCSCRAAA